MVDVSAGSNLIAPGEFRVGAVFSRTFAILGRNFVPILALSAIAALPYLFIYLNQKTGAAVNAGGPAQQAAALRRAFSSTGPVFFMGFVLRLLSQAVIVNGAFQDMRGRKFQIGDSLRTGFSRFLPILGLVICEGFGLVLGLVALVIPFFILMTVWAAALPACVVEKLGPFESLGRSAALTKGHRWKLFGILILLGLANLVGAGIVTGILLALGGKIGSAVGQYAWQAVYIGVYSVVTVVIYHDLRVANEGVDTETIAAVFD